MSKKKHKEVFARLAIEFEIRGQRSEIRGQR
jgi:hypothetical protein